jgi:hypothetical protein
MVRRVRGGLGISADLLIAPLPTKSTSRSKSKPKSQAIEKEKAKQIMLAKA